MVHPPRQGMPTLQGVLTLRATRRKVTMRQMAHLPLPPEMTHLPLPPPDRATLRRVRSHRLSPLPQRTMSRRRCKRPSRRTSLPNMALQLLQRHQLQARLVVNPRTRRVNPNGAKRPFKYRMMNRQMMSLLPGVGPTEADWMSLRAHAPKATCLSGPGLPDA